MSQPMETTVYLKSRMLKQLLRTIKRVPTDIRNFVNCFVCTRTIKFHKKGDSFACSKNCIDYHINNQYGC